MQINVEYADLVLLDLRFVDQTKTQQIFKI
jgi:hypothetical protein